MARLRQSPYVVATAVAAVAFIAFSAWWLFYDHRIPGGGDASRQLFTALTAGELMADARIGDLVELGPNGAFFYPPLVHWIGGVPAALGLPLEDWGTLALNLVFVPMLAAGCYGVGRLVFGPLAGLLAAVFALATPMVLSMFHVFLLDAPLAAAIAIAVWALLASENFSRRRQSVVAGALVGIALLVKSLAVIFLIGPVAVMILAGGWRQWRNLAFAGLAALVVAGPYYALHLSEVVSLSGQTTSSGQLQGEDLAFDPAGVYDRFSLDNFLYYGWVGINIQYFVPFAAALVVGLVLAVRQVRTRPQVAPVLAGVIVSYLFLTFVLSIRDPRYSLPMIIFVAVLATGWIAELRRPGIRGLCLSVLAAVVVVNVASAATERVPNVRLTISKSDSGDLRQPGSFTFADQRGSTVGAPRPDRFWDRLLAEAREQGVEMARYEAVEPVLWGSEPLGFAIVADDYGIEEHSYARKPARAQLRINTWTSPTGRLLSLKVGAPRPCGIVEEGSNAAGTAPMPVRVAVRLRGDDGRLRRWCDF